jgi:DNA repair exonuclease SbcCD ATPase subunit
MRPLRVCAHNFKSYADVDIDLSKAGIYSLQGVNGTGKSSLGDAILFPLTGLRTISDKKLEDFVREGTDECRVSVTFQMRTATYLCTRTVSIRGGKATSALELAREREQFTCEDDRWEPEGSGVTDTEKRLRAILGADEETLWLTNFIGQEDTGAFFKLTAAKRIQAVLDILRLDVTYGPLEAYFKLKAAERRDVLIDARNRLQQCGSDIAGLQERKALLAEATATLSTITERIVAAEARVTTARERARTAQDGLVDAKSAQVRAEELLKQRDALGERKDALAEERRGLLDRIARKTDLEAKLAGREALQQELDALQQAEKADALLNEQRAVLGAEIKATKDAITSTYNQGKPKADEMAGLVKRRDDLTSRVEAIETAETPICDRCGQEIADEALARTLEQLRADQQDVTQAVDRLDAEVTALRGQLAEQKTTLASQEQQLAEIPANAGNPERMQKVKDALADLEEIPAKLAEISVCEERAQALAEEIKKLAAEWSDDRDLQAAQQEALLAEGKIEEAKAADAEVTAAEDSLPAIRAEKSQAEKTIGRHEEALSALAGYEQEAEELRAAIKADEQLLARYELLAAHMGKRGVPLLIVGNVLAALEARVNEILSTFNGGFSVRFDTEKQIGTGETRDSLEINVFNGRFWRKFETFSGGQRYRIAVSMRLALAQLLAHRSGANVDMAFVDEPEGLDLEGRQYLMRILEGLSQDLGLVLLASHYPDLKDALPSQIMFTLDEDGVSHVEVAA